MKSWVKGALIGFVIGVLLYFSLSFICSDFYRIGPMYPTDQPICHFLVVQNGWIYGIVMMILLGALIGFVIGKYKSKGAK